MNSKQITPEALIGRLNVHLLNTAILPVVAPAGEYTLLDCDSEQARRLVYAAIQGNNDGGGPFFDCHVGHEATAQVCSDELRSRMDVDRTPWDGTGVGLACQLLGRAPEGKILTRPEMEAIGWRWRIIVNTQAATDAIAAAENVNEELRSWRIARGLDPETGERMAPGVTGFTSEPLNADLTKNQGFDV